MHGNESTNRSETTPELSIVATARNDDHGGNLLGRMQLFMSGILEQCNRFDLPAELILVEWNPPDDRPRLVEALDWRDHGSRCQVRLIEVPHEIHNRYEHSEALPLFQMIAKNVGVRRARGEFILATNIDILFSDAMMAFLSKQSLRHDSMYRVDRYDVEPSPKIEDSVPERLRWCGNHVIRRNGRFESIDLRTGTSYSAGWKPTWRVRLLERLQDLHLVPTVTRPPLHLNGCGDFTLLHRGHWFNLRGYAELEMYSMHLDSLLCTAAAVSGLKEVVLQDPMRIYHVEHGSGSGFKPENVQALNNRLHKSGIPQMSMTDFHRYAIEMRRNAKPILINDDQWGLGNENLRETNPLVETHAISAVSRSESSLTAVTGC